jgi:hypothetical protein
MHKFLLLALCLLALPARGQEPARVTPEELRATADKTLPALATPDCPLSEKACAERLLTSARDLEQAIRRAMMPCGGNADAQPCLAPYIALLDRVDAAATDLLRRVLDLHGWPAGPGWGKGMGQTAWLLAQHADADRPFQRRALALLETAVREGRAELRHQAYLHDRLAVADGRPQLYATQGGCEGDSWQPKPVEDEAGLDARRAAAGLEPLADYRAKLNRLCTGRR